MKDVDKIRESVAEYKKAMKEKTEKLNKAVEEIRQVRQVRTESPTR